LALHDPRIVEMLDVKVHTLPSLAVNKADPAIQIFVEADMDVCLGRRGKCHWFLIVVTVTDGDIDSPS
jgi:hypothetical protein